MSVEDNLKSELGSARKDLNDLDCVIRRIRGVVSSDHVSMLEHIYHSLADGLLPAIESALEELDSNE